MSGDSFEPEGTADTLRRGRPPYERMGRGIPFEDLPEGCRRLAVDAYRELWGL
jgi:hypothetical protein